MNTNYFSLWKKVIAVSVTALVFVRLKYPGCHPRVKATSPQLFCGWYDTCVICSIKNWNIKKLLAMKHTHAYLSTYLQGRKKSFQLYMPGWIRALREIRIKPCILVVERFKTVANTYELLIIFRNCIADSVSATLRPIRQICNCVYSHPSTFACVFFR